MRRISKPTSPAKNKNKKATVKRRVRGEFVDSTPTAKDEVKVEARKEYGAVDKPLSARTDGDTATTKTKGTQPKAATGEDLPDWGESTLATYKAVATAFDEVTNELSTSGLDECDDEIVEHTIDSEELQHSQTTLSSTSEDEDEMGSFVGSLGDRGIRKRKGTTVDSDKKVKPHAAKTYNGEFVYCRQKERTREDSQSIRVARNSAVEKPKIAASTRRDTHAAASVLLEDFDEYSRMTSGTNRRSEFCVGDLVKAKKLHSSGWHRAKGDCVGCRCK